MTGITSLGGPMKVGYLTLPRTKVRDEIAFASGGMVPELANASPEEIQAMVMRGELSPQLAQKIIMERSATQPQQAPAPLNPPQTIQPGIREQLGNMIGMPRRGSEQRFAPMPSDADKYAGAAPPPSPRTAMGGVNSDEVAAQNAAVDEKLFGTGPYRTPQDKLRADRESLGNRMGLAPYRPGASTALGLENANADVPVAPQGEGNPLEVANAGVSSLPTPPKGPASDQPGGIVPPQDPMAPEAYAKGLTNPDDPMAPDAYAPSGVVAGGEGLPQDQQQGGPDMLTKLTSTASPQMREAAQGADNIFGKGRGWEAMMMLGLGMMASRNPSALGAAGEGGIAAMKYLTDRRKEDRDQQRLDREDNRSERRLAQGDRQLDISEKNAQRGTAYYDALTKKTLTEIEQIQKADGAPAEVKALKWKYDMVQKAKGGDKEAGQFIEFLDKGQNEKTFRDASEEASKAAGNVATQFDVPGKPGASPEERYNYTYDKVMRMKLGDSYKKKYGKEEEVSSSPSTMPKTGAIPIGTIAADKNGNKVRWDGTNWAPFR